MAKLPVFGTQNHGSESPDRQTHTQVLEGLEGPMSHVFAMRHPSPNSPTRGKVENLLKQHFGTHWGHLYSNPTGGSPSLVKGNGASQATNVGANEGASFVQLDSGFNVPSRCIDHCM